MQDRGPESSFKSRGEGRGYTPIYKLYGYVPQYGFRAVLVWNRVWFWQGTCSFISLVILTLTRDIQTASSGALCKTLGSIPLPPRGGLNPLVPLVSSVTVLVSCWEICTYHSASVQRPLWQLEVRYGCNRGGSFFSLWHPLGGGGGGRLWEIFLKHLHKEKRRMNDLQRTLEGRIFYVGFTYWRNIFQHTVVKQFFSSPHYPYPGSRGFLSPRRDETRKRKKRWEKTSGCGRCESHYHSAIGVNQHHEID